MGKARPGQFQVGRYPVPVPWCTTSRCFPFHCKVARPPGSLLLKALHGHRILDRSGIGIHMLFNFQQGGRSSKSTSTQAPAFCPAIYHLSSALHIPQTGPLPRYRIRNSCFLLLPVPFCRLWPFPFLDHRDDRCSWAGCRINSVILTAVLCTLRPGSISLIHREKTCATPGDRIPVAGCSRLHHIAIRDIIFAHCKAPLDG